MVKTLAFAVVASSALWIGSVIGAVRPPKRGTTAALLAFASGALLTAVAYDLFQEAFDRGGALRAGTSLVAGAGAFIGLDTWLEKRTERRRTSGASVGLALLAGVTLDGVPENLAMGVSLIGSGSVTLLVAIFASNLPEAVVGAQKMREDGMDPRSILTIWGLTGVVLAVAVVAGYVALEGVGRDSLGWPLGFAAGAVLASLADTLMPEAYREGGPTIAFATAAGFLLSFLVSTV